MLLLNLQPEYLIVDESVLAVESYHSTRPSLVYYEFENPAIHPL